MNAPPVTCPNCHHANPEVASFCYACGRNLRRDDPAIGARSDSYAIQSAERVGQFALISTVMPHTSREHADGYRWAVVVGTLAVVILSLVGLLPAAIVAAAFLVPLAYLYYIYDTNLWEEAPVPVIGSLFLFTGALSAIISIVFYRFVFESYFVELAASASGIGGGVSELPVVPLLLFVVLLPIVAEAAKQIGPLALARRPQFDDMIDCLTFGVASGTAYAGFETVVAFAPVFAAGQVQTNDGLLSWLVVVLNLMIVKSLIYGTATGLALAAFSGRGDGYDGFTPRYYSSLALAVGANALYWLGTRLLAYAPFGDGLGLLWGVAILAVLVIRVRVILHASLLEAAVEDALKGVRSKAATTGSGVCPECEVHLLPDSMFCISCGTSVRATSAQARRQIREPTEAR